MAGLYGSGGQFGGMFNNAMMNQYNQQMWDWTNQNQQQDAQYQSDYDYWNQMNQYDQDRQGYDMWSSGASRGAPINPRQAPINPNQFGWGAPPPEPEQMNFGGFGGFGGGGGNQMPTWQGGMPGAFQGSGYQAPAAWVDPGIDTAQMVDPSQLIASAQPGIMEKMNTNFAEAGNRFGSSGMVGTPYSDSLGAASRGASNDIAHITDQYTYQAGESAANREQARAMAEYQANQNAWAQQGMWENQGQLAQMNQDFGAWSQMGDWQNQNNMGQNQFNQQNWQTQGNWDQQNQQQMMQMMMQMFGGGGMY